MEIKSLVAKLSKFYWSPNHPQTYTLRGADGKHKGVGNIAHHDYGAFNLAWAEVQDQWKTPQEQVAFVARFAEWRTVTGIIVDKYPLREWATLLTPAEFKVFLDTADINKKHKFSLRVATELAIKLGASHGVS